MPISKQRTSGWPGTAAVFIAASAAGGLVKFPSPVGSIAFDAAPGYFLAAYVHPVLGGLVGAIGHIASAAAGGFPLGVVHVVIAFQMFFWCSAFGLIARAVNKHWALVPAGIFATLLNGVAGPMILGILGIVPMGLARAVIPVLSAASAINIVIASVAIILIANRERLTRVAR